VKVLILNGSPRKNGNTSTALEAVKRGIENNIKEAEVLTVDVCGLDISGCINCDSCKSNGGLCVTDSDSVKITQAIYDADVILVGTPVYWWGMTAQLKLVVDKMYSRSEQFKQQDKKAGIVITGMADLSDPEYDLIKDQMKCICSHLGWQMIFSEAIVTAAEDTVRNDTEKNRYLETLWRKIL